MINNNTPFQLTLDDGRVINNKLNNLSRDEVISIAYQYRRTRQNSIADGLMLYQHKKFSTNSPRKV